MRLHAVKHVTPPPHTLSGLKVNECAGRFVAKALYCLASKDCLNGFDKKQILNIVSLLEDSLEDDHASFDVAQTVLQLISKNLLKKFERNEMLNLTKILKLCLGNEKAMPISNQALEMLKPQARNKSRNILNIHYKNAG